MYNAKELNSKIIKIEKISRDTKLGLTGEFQYDNASTAFTAAKFIIPSISLPKVKKGLARTSWFGRIQKIHDGKSVDRGLFGKLPPELQRAGRDIFNTARRNLPTGRIFKGKIFPPFT